MLLNLVRRAPRTRKSLIILLAGFLALLSVTPAVQAAERAKVRAFLETTGFDVALDSIAQTAGMAPSMLGLEEATFGSDWERLTAKVFAADLMRDMALDILEQALDDRILSHAAAFYASDLGQRLVAAEDASHMMPDDGAKTEEGQEIVAKLLRDGSDRLELFKRMHQAISPGDTGIRAIQEIQIRFLLAASAAGVIELQFDADQLRSFMKAQEGGMRRSVMTATLAGNAYTYRDFSDAELEVYTKALEEPDMRQVYELLNAVQWEITANRLEALAARMDELTPVQDI